MTDATERVTPPGPKTSRKGKAIGSRSSAINKHCKKCIYDPNGGQGTWRQQTEACTYTECDLYAFRPVSLAPRDTPITIEEEVVVLEDPPERRRRRRRDAST